MKKIALIRSVDISQAEPTLSNMSRSLSQTNEELTFKLYYSDGEISKKNIFDEVQTFDSKEKPESLVEKIASWNPDLVISLSLPDNNALRDSIMKDLLKHNYNIDMVMHPIQSVSLLSNKWDTNLWLKTRGYPAPTAIHVSSEILKDKSEIARDYDSYIDSIYTQLDEMSGPFIIKPLWNSMSIGVIEVKDPLSACHYLNENPDQDYIIQEKINGDLYGIEVLRNNGQTLLQPLVKKCSIPGDTLMPFSNLRYGEVQIKSELDLKIQEDIKKISTELNLNGSVEFELIIEDNDYKIIEINPRISGMTNLSSAISQINTFDWLIESYFEIPKIRDFSKNKFVFEFPVNKIDTSTILKTYAPKNLISDQKVTYHNGDKGHKLLWSENSLQKMLDDILFLENKNVINVPPIIIEELKNELLEQKG